MCDTAIVKRQKRVLLFAALGLILGAAAFWAFAAIRSYRMSRLPALLARVPSRDAVVFYIDFQQLRRAGILQLLSGSGVAGEPEYRDFIRNTNFDYTRDLDAALVSLVPEGKFFLLRGRFDWNKIDAYAQQQGGSCYRGMCEMPGSKPERHISFFPLQSGLMAMAVGRSSLAVTTLSEPAPDQPRIEIPADPLWISIPPSAVREGNNFPAGTRMFAKSMENADSILLSFGTGGGAFDARLNVLCRTTQDAAALADQLSKTTSLLRDLISRENRTPNVKDLSGVLTAGTFRQDGRRVFGHWPIPKMFMQGMLPDSSH